MPHAGLFSLLAKGPICRRTEPTEFRQTIRARLSGDARLGQDSAGPALAEGSYRKNLCEISGSISPTDGERHRERLKLSAQKIQGRTHATARDPKRNSGILPDASSRLTSLQFRETTCH